MSSLGRPEKARSRALMASSAAAAEDATTVGTRPRRRSMTGPCDAASDRSARCGRRPVSRWVWPRSGRPGGDGGSRRRRPSPSPSPSPSRFLLPAAVDERRSAKSGTATAAATSATSGTAMFEREGGNDDAARRDRDDGQASGRHASNDHSISAATHAMAGGRFGLWGIGLAAAVAVMICIGRVTHVAILSTRRESDLFQDFCST
jgi:hypothetical protein